MWAPGIQRGPKFLRGLFKKALKVVRHSAPWVEVVADVAENVAPRKWPGFEGHMGELSSMRQALVGEVVAPGDQATYSQLTDATRRPARPPDPFISISMRTGFARTSGLQEKGRSRSSGHDLGALAPVVGGCPRHEVVFNFGFLSCQSTNPGRRHPCIAQTRHWSARDCGRRHHETFGGANDGSSCSKRWRWQLRLFNARCPPKQGVNAWLSPRFDPFAPWHHLNVH